MIHSRSYSFLFTLTIAFIAIFDYSTNLTFKILHSYHNQCAYKTKRFSTTTSSKPKKALQINAQAALDISAID